MEYKKLSKKAMGCMYVATLTGTLIGCSILASAWYLLVQVNGVTEWEQLVNSAFLIITVLLAVNMICSPKIRYERYRYSINAESIDVKEGLLFARRNIVPIERLHKLSVEKGPIDRLFGLAKVIVTTAGGDVTIRFLEDEAADFIADSLKKKINQIVLDEKSE